MVVKILLLSVIIQYQIYLTDQYVLESVIGLPAFRNIRTLLYRRVGRTSEDPIVLETAKKQNILQVQIPENVRFPCQTKGFRSKTPPKTVDEVRPGDIDIIGAMGDSLTVGQGLMATSLVNLFQENRGISWSIGGLGTWRQFLTLPNILKEFNPNIFGYALRDSLSIDRASQFNVAESGSVSYEMPYMAKILVKRIKNDPRTDIKKHWKLITYMIGANDICGEICFRDDIHRSAEKFRTTQIQVLRTLRDELPRTIVNLVQVPTLKRLTETTLQNKPKQCYTLNDFECPCLFGLRYQELLPTFYEINKQWQKVNEQVAQMEEFHTKDFTVIYQPFVKYASVPLRPDNLTDYTYMSYDCFHLSQKFNAAVANNLWNNMMEPVGSKSEAMTPLFERFVCPTEMNPYIFTKTNSVS